MSDAVPDPSTILAALTVDEKLALLAGHDLWSTVPVERLGVPSVAVTDGPSGARGPWLPGSHTPRSVCVPAGTALGATWDPALVERVGRLVAGEARDRGCRILLAPTANLHRSPLAGRNFECYGEDPIHAGTLAAAFVRGAQAKGVVATVKHFVANDQETERASIDAVVDERTLREIYLRPFELAVREGGALGVMTAYNRVNGRWVTESSGLLTAILREEWGFTGLVMTDWFGIASTAGSLDAGLDLEMPGPGRAFGPALHAAVAAGDVSEEALDRPVRHLVTTLDRIGAFVADVPDGPRQPSDADLEVARDAAASSVVLLTNDGTLPLRVPSQGTVAVVGPNADALRVMGGGSSEVRVGPMASPVDELASVLGPEVEVRYERGCDIDRRGRPLGDAGLRAVDGFQAELFARPDPVGPPDAHEHLDVLRYLVLDGPSPQGHDAGWSLRARGTVVAREDGCHRLLLAHLGRVRLFVDGCEVGFESRLPVLPQAGALALLDQYGEAEVSLRAGEPVEIFLTLEAPSRTGGVEVCVQPPERSDLVERAVEAARDADAVVVVVGTTPEHETEMADRRSLVLPGDQDALVSAVAAVNPRTVVVVNSGGLVELPWIDDVAAGLMCWFGGQAMPTALVDVLVGAAEPGGRLPATLPVRLEHSPSFDNFPGENGQVRYGEGLFMGYRGHDRRSIAPRFAFGHGLSYTQFAWGTPELSAQCVRPGDTVVVSVPVTNTGTRAGSDVVQCYVAPQCPRLVRPAKELRAFAKVRLAPGETTVVDLELDERAFAYWDPGQPDWDQVWARVEPVAFVDPTPRRDRRAPGWQVDPGVYDLLVARSADDVAHTLRVELVEPS
jgi:beta-glucosidase